MRACGGTHYPTGRWRAVLPAGLIPGGTRTTLGAWDLGPLMDQLDEILAPIGEEHPGQPA